MRSEWWRCCVPLLAAAAVAAACRSDATIVTEASLLRAGEIAESAHHFDRVLVIVLENQTYVTVSRDPYFAALAKRGALFSEFRGLFHPSYPNYLAMVSGRAFRTPGDRQVTVDYPSLGDALKSKGLGWKDYAEDYPGTPGHCFLGSQVDRYARRHVPLLSFRSVQRAGCVDVVPGEEFARDLSRKALPAYAFYSPNLDHDGHDPVWDPSVGRRKAAAWLHSFLEPMLDRSQLPGTLVVLTFDESEGRDPQNRIFTVFFGDMVRPGTVAGSYNHFNVLRTIEDDFGLQPLAEGDRRARPIVGVWK